MFQTGPPKIHPSGLKSRAGFSSRSLMVEKDTDIWHSMYINLSSIRVLIQSKRRTQLSGMWRTKSSLRAGSRYLAELVCPVLVLAILSSSLRVRGGNDWCLAGSWLLDAKLQNEKKSFHTAFIYYFCLSWEKAVVLMSKLVSSFWDQGSYIDRTNFLKYMIQDLLENWKWKSHIGDKITNCWFWVWDWCF